MKRYIFLVFAVSVLTFTGAAGSNAAPKDSPAPLSQTPPAGIAAQEATLLSGKVVETMNGGGYTYVSIEKNGKQAWFAVPMTEIKVGQEVTFRPGTEMGRFTSRALNRTFENIIFSGGIASPGGAAGSAVSSSAQKAAAPSTEKITVEKASGPDAYTVGEIYEKRAALNGKNIVLNAKVVKVSERIMGKNWVHVQDGTGDPTRKTHSLVVTSDDLPAVGDVVTITGTVSTDRDFGSGYKFNVIIEKAGISKR
jgi:hypothetical protein